MEINSTIRIDMEGVAIGKKMVSITSVNAK
jgi:hypothetical protein